MTFLDDIQKKQFDREGDQMSWHLLIVDNWSMQDSKKGFLFLLGRTQAVPGNTVIEQKDQVFLATMYRGELKSDPKIARTFQASVSKNKIHQTTLLHTISWT